MFEILNIIYNGLDKCRFCLFGFDLTLLDIFLGTILLSIIFKIIGYILSN